MAVYCSVNSSKTTYQFLILCGAITTEWLKCKKVSEIVVWHKLGNCRVGALSEYLYYVNALQAEKNLTASLRLSFDLSSYAKKILPSSDVS